MIHQDDAVAFRPIPLPSHRVDGPSQSEAGHDVRNHPHTLAIDVANGFFAGRCVGNGHDRVGVRVIDVLERNECVQNGFDGGGGRIGVEHRGSLGTDHVRVVELLECRHAQEHVQTDRSEAGGLDGFQVPSTALHVDHPMSISEEVGRGRLDRGIAAAV